jgi:hypothetical protein
VAVTSRGVMSSLRVRRSDGVKRTEAAPVSDVRDTEGLRLRGKGQSMPRRLKSFRL